jgi:hypothetical protein
MSDTITINPARRLFAAVMSPTRRRQNIFYPSISSSARDARAAAADGFPGGWPELRKHGWRIVRVDVFPSEDR